MRRDPRRPGRRRAGRRGHPCLYDRLIRKEVVDPPDRDTPVDLNVVALQWAAGPPGFQKLRAKLLAEVRGNQINRLRCKRKKKCPAPDCLSAKPDSLLTS